MTLLGVGFMNGGPDIVMRGNITDINKHCHLLLNTVTGGWQQSIALYPIDRTLSASKCNINIYGKSHAIRSASFSIDLYLCQHNKTIFMNRKIYILLLSEFK